MRLTEEKIQDALDAAHKIRNEYFSDNNVRFAFERIYEHYKIKVHKEKSRQPIRMEGDEYILTVQYHIKIELNNYRIAHDIGHIVLGHDIEKLQKMSYTTNPISDEERQANIFAAELLMPKSIFRDVCKRFKNNVEKIADYFDVAQSVVIVRMAILNI